MKKREKMEEKRREKMKGKMKDKMKRDRGEKKFFFLKPARLISPTCFEKNPRRTIYSSMFSSKVQNLTVFSIIYMIRIRFSGRGN